MTQHPETSSLSADLGTEWLESEYRGTIVCKICTQVLRRLALLRCKFIAVMKTWTLPIHSPHFSRQHPFPSGGFILNAKSNTECACVMTQAETTYGASTVTDLV